MSAAGATFAPHDDLLHPSWAWVLRERHVQLVCRRRPRCIPDVTDHADDRHEVHRVESALDAAADGIWFGKQLAHKRLADDDDKRRVVAILRGEIAAANAAESRAS